MAGGPPRENAADKVSMGSVEAVEEAKEVRELGRAPVDKRDMVDDESRNDSRCMKQPKFKVPKGAQPKGNSASDRAVAEETRNYVASLGSEVSAVCEPGTAQESTRECEARPTAISKVTRSVGASATAHVEMSSQTKQERDPAD